MEHNETSAHGVRGYLLRTTEGDLIFRVYTDATRQKYKDYKINHCDLEVEIVDRYSSLYEGDSDKPNSLDYSSRVKKGELS